ncbi:unnamed protein product [Phaeothamnion confervicola]
MAFYDGDWLHGCCGNGDDAAPFDNGGGVHAVVLPVWRLLAVSMMAASNDGRGCVRDDAGGDTDRRGGRHAACTLFDRCITCRIERWLESNRWQPSIINQVETVARPYAFIKFDKVIQRKRKEYLDPNSRGNMARLQDDLADIHNIMKKNIQEVLNRGDKLDHVSQISRNLASQAEQFKWGSQKLSLMVSENLQPLPCPAVPVARGSCHNVAGYRVSGNMLRLNCGLYSFQSIATTLQALWQKYGPVAAISVVVLFTLYYKFLW